MNEPGREPPVKLVCFDWGGVILKHCRSWKEACGVAGIAVRDGHDHPDMVARRRTLTQEFQRGRIEPADFFPRMSHACDGLYSVAEVERLHDAWLTEEYTGMESLIRRLIAVWHVETALLSNTNHAHWVRHLPVNGRGPDFPTAGLLKHRHASHLLGLAKPEPEIYRAFEGQVGYRGGEILFFDDLEDNTRAAAALGWRTCLVDHTTETAPQVEAALVKHAVLER